MGWLFQHGATRADIIKNCIQLQDNDEACWTTLAHCTKGNVLWAVFEIFRKQKGDTRRFIGCILIAPQKNFGWGYKEMSESMGPCYYSCPLSYLDMAPEADTAWRALVRQYHARCNCKIVVGEVWSLPHCNIPQITITSVRPLQGCHEGRLYRLSRKQLGERLSEAPTSNTLSPATAMTSRRSSATTTA